MPVETCNWGGLFIQAFWLASIVRILFEIVVEAIGKIAVVQIRFMLAWE